MAVTLAGAAECVVELLGLAGASVEKGNVVLHSNGLRRSLRVARVRREADMLSWTVFVEDEALADPMKAFGGVGVEVWRPDHVRGEGDVTSVHHRYLNPWPKNRTALDPVLERDLREFGPAALDFVRDREDLARILLAPDDVHRGPVWAQLPKGTEPARLVKAFILARAGAHSGLEEEAWEKLRRLSESDISWEPGTTFLFRQAVADWARQYARKVDVALDDLIALKRRRPPAGPVP